MRKWKNLWRVAGAALLIAITAIVVGGCGRDAEKSAKTGDANGEGEAAVVNVRCPIMGTAIDPANVPDGLTRTYKGQKVGFCCESCPRAWDKLSDQQKQEKLEKAIDQ